MWQIRAVFQVQSNLYLSINLFRKVKLKSDSKEIFNILQ